MTCLLDDDQSWNTTRPEFSQCFRQTVLIWIPSAFLWLFAPMECIIIARSKARLIPWNIYNMSRIISVAIICLFALLDCLFCIYLYGVHDEQRDAFQFAAPFVTFATFLLLEYFIDGGEYTRVEWFGFSC
ncbi:unnamed protein product [Medioppia subpectinata]|uniref:ABC transporter TMD0 domain-containing protein n=1 Tax=Medioppia subpectinata TaxID=1979941 RepID=A0A7R9KQ61_9ACAR|nr:unnamed protein product [Medioppia subpectinata]CAG2107355.1 unnamed protein product [Medioppia subpectinata]